MFAVKAKIYGVLFKRSSSIAFDETSSYWLAPKTPNFSAFHWSPCGSLVSIGQHFVATRVVHLPRSTETSLITESDQSGHNHQLLQLCTSRTAWSESDQAVRAVHSCISWLKKKPISFRCIWFSSRYGKILETDKLPHIYEVQSPVYYSLTSFMLFFCRYYAICHPLSVQYRCTWNRARTMMLIMWCISACLALPTIFMTVNIFLIMSEHS